MNGSSTVVTESADTEKPCEKFDPGMLTIPLVATAEVMNSFCTAGPKPSKKFCGNISQKSVPWLPLEPGGWVLPALTGAVAPLPLRYKSSSAKRAVMRSIFVPAGNGTETSALPLTSVTALKTAPFSVNCTGLPASGWLANESTSCARRVKGAAVVWVGGEFRINAVGRLLMIKAALADPVPPSLSVIESVATKLPGRL